MTVSEERDSDSSGNGGKIAPEDTGSEPLLKPEADDTSNAESEKQNGCSVVVDTKQESPGRKVEFDLDEEESQEDKVKPEDAALMSIEVSQQADWIPDGGWGWAVVVGGVIVHIYIGRQRLKLYTTFSL